MREQGWKKRNRLFRHKVLGFLCIVSILFIIFMPCKTDMSAFVARSGLFYAHDESTGSRCFHRTLQHVGCLIIHVLAGGTILPLFFLEIRCGYRDAWKDQPEGRVIFLAEPLYRALADPKNSLRWRNRSSCRVEKWFTLVSFAWLTLLPWALGDISQAVSEPFWFRFKICADIWYFIRFDFDCSGR